MAIPQLLDSSYIEKYSETITQPYRNGGYKTYEDGAHEYTPPVYSTNFQAFLDDMRNLRIELADGEHNKQEACFQAMRIATEYGLESFVTITGNEIKTSFLQQIRDEIKKLSFKHAEVESLDDYDLCDHARPDEWINLDVNKTREREIEIDKQISADIDALNPTLELAPADIINVEALTTRITEVLEEMTGLKGLFHQNAGQVNVGEAVRDLLDRAREPLQRNHLRYEQTLFYLSAQIIRTGHVKNLECGLIRIPLNI